MKTHLLNSAKALTATALITGGIALTTPAYAITTQSDQVTTKIDVRDLQSERGIERVYKALANRAESACITRGNKSLNARKVEDACVERLLSD